MLVKVKMRRFNSMNLSNRKKIKNHRTIRLQAFLSPQRANVTQWSNYLPQWAEILTHRSNLTPQREEYCE